MPTVTPGPDPHLEIYLLGRARYGDVLALQRRLVYEVSERRTSAALIVCEHPPTITLGRQGSDAQILYERSELLGRGWPVVRVNRGDGCLLHLPGQMTVYPVIALDAFRLTPTCYVRLLGEICRNLLGESHLLAEPDEGTGSILVGGRPIGQVGVAVRDWVAYHGFSINLNPDLELFRKVRCGGHAETMTSVQRELRMPVRPAEFRQRVVTGFRERLRFERWSVLHHHPALPRKRSTDAITTHYRQAD